MVDGLPEYEVIAKARFSSFRPISASDLPRLYALRLPRLSHNDVTGPVTPSFEDWQQSELQELRRDGRAVIVQSSACETIGLVKVHRLNPVDRWAYLSLDWYSQRIGEVAWYEALLFAGDHTFRQLRLRKVYTETHELDSEVLAMAAALGMTEEVRFSQQLVLNETPVDVIHMTLAVETWGVCRERLVNQIDVMMALGES